MTVGTSRELFTFKTFLSLCQQRGRGLIENYFGVNLRYSKILIGLEKSHDQNQPIKILKFQRSVNLCQKFL